MTYAKRIVVLGLAFALLALPLATSNAATAVPDKIKIGAALPLSGWAASSAESPQTLNYKDVG